MLQLFRIIERFPLHLKICKDCRLGQVADVVTPERIFRDYRYLSSMSTTFLNHAADYVGQRIAEDLFSHSDWVLEIASNDGYLLKNFIPHGIKTIGVEPAENVAEISNDAGAYLCNYVYFKSLSKSYSKSKIIFIHVADYQNNKKATTAEEQGLLIYNFIKKFLESSNINEIN